MDFRGLTMQVVILVPNWYGVIGILEDHIPNTDWWNVRINSDLRLALTQDEFSHYG